MTSWQNLLSLPIVPVLGWTLLHTVWQGLVIAVLLRAAFIALRGRSPNVRYVVACAALLFMAMAPVVTLTRLTVSDARSARTGPAISPGTAGESSSLLRPADRLPLPLAAVPRESTLRPAAPTDASTALPRSVPWTTWLPHRLEATLPWVVLGWLAGVLVLSVRLFGGASTEGAQSLSMPTSSLTAAAAG